MDLVHVCAWCEPGRRGENLTHIACARHHLDLMIVAPLQTVIARLLSTEYLSTLAREQMAIALGAVLERMEDRLEIGGAASVLPDPTKEEAPHREQDTGAGAARR